MSSRPKRSWACGSSKKDEKTPRYSNHLLRTIYPFLFVIPKPTRISYFTALNEVAYVVLLKRTTCSSSKPQLSSGNPGSRGICSSADLSWKCFRLTTTTGCRSLPDIHFESGSFRCGPHCVPTTAFPDRPGTRPAGLRPFAKMQPSWARSSREKTAPLRAEERDSQTAGCAAAVLSTRHPIRLQP